MCVKALLVISDVCVGSVWYVVHDGFKGRVWCVCMMCSVSGMCECVSVLYC